MAILRELVFNLYLEKCSLIDWLLLFFLFLFPLIGLNLFVLGIVFAVSLFEKFKILLHGPDLVLTKLGPDEILCLIIRLYLTRRAVVSNRLSNNDLA